MELVEKLPERQSERESQLLCMRKHRAMYTRGWRVFAEERKLTAERDLAALPTREARRRRRSGLPAAETPEEMPFVACFDLWLRTYRIALLPGGDRIVTTSRTGSLWVSAFMDGAPLWDVGAHNGGIGGDARPQVAVLGDGIVASGGEDDFLRTWNADTGEQLCEIKVCGRGVCALATINDRQVVAGCRCGDISFYNHEQGTRLVQAFRFVDADPHAGKFIVGFAVCGGRLASASIDGEVTIWDLAARCRAAVIGGNGAGWVRSVDMNDSVVVTASYYAPHVRVYSAADDYSCIGSPCACTWVHDGVVRSVRILGGGYVLSTSDDRTIAISALHSNEVIARMKLDFGPRLSAVLPDGSIAVNATPSVSGYREGTIVFPAPPAAASLLKAYGELQSRARSAR